MSNYPPGNDPYGQQPPYQGDPYQQGYPPPQNQQPKKGNKVLMWSLIGCGSFVVIGIICVGVFMYWVSSKVDMSLAERNPALAAAKLAISMNSDVELISIDEDKGTLTIKDKKSGKVITINADQAKDGKVTVSESGKDDVTLEVKGSGDSGSLEMKKGSESVKLGSNSDASLPDWMPEYPGTPAQSVYSATTDETISASFTFTTDDSPAEVIEFYRSELEDGGFKVTTSTVNQGGQSTSQVTAQDSSYRRIGIVTATTEAGSTKVMLIVTTKK